MTLKTPLAWSLSMAVTTGAFRTSDADQSLEAPESALCHSLDTLLPSLMVNGFDVRAQW